MNTFMRDPLNDSDSSVLVSKSWDRGRLLSNSKKPKKSALLSLGAGLGRPQACKLYGNSSIKVKVR